MSILSTYCSTLLANWSTEPLLLSVAFPSILTPQLPVE
jgi:hypothetical protein